MVKSQYLWKPNVARGGHVNSSPLIIKQKKMYKHNKQPKTQIKRNTSYEGETIEMKVNRIVNNKEPISDGAPLIYTDRKDGALPQYDIRTDRFEIAIEAMDKVTASHQAKREMRIGERTFDTMTDEQKTKFHEKYPTNKYNKKESGAQPTQGTENK